MLHHAALPVLTPAAARRRGALLLLLALLAVGHAQAQAPGTGGPAPIPAAVPLDGGASLVLAAGVAYGLRRLRRRQR